MIVDVLSESSADEAAIRILVDAVLQLESQAPPGFPRMEFRRGFRGVLKVIPAVLKHAYYQTDADLLVVVLDSNGTPVTEGTSGEKRESRLYRIRQLFDETWKHIKKRNGRRPLQTTVGLAAPALEAWLRCGIDDRVTEAAWIRDLKAGASAPRRIRELKQAVYGTDKPSLDQETSRATEEARRLAEDIGALERSFPIGFGSLARDVRARKDPT